MTRPARCARMRVPGNSFAGNADKHLWNGGRPGLCEGSGAAVVKGERSHDYRREKKAAGQLALPGLA